MPISEFIQAVPFSGDVGPLLILSIILLAGVVGSWLASLIHVPRVTGNIVAGVIIGPTVLNLFGDVDVAVQLQPLSTFAMGLIAVSVGSQLSYRRIHNALRRIVTITAGEVILAVTLVTLVCRFLGLAWPQAFLLGCIAAATAPTTTVAVIRECNAKGTYVKTLLSVVALDNMLCIMLFAFASTILADLTGGAQEAPQILAALSHTGWQFLGSLILGLGLGLITEWLVHKPYTHNFSVVTVAILLATGLSEILDLSPLLSSLFYGAYLGNASEEAGRQTRALEPIELLLFVCFFTLAGASLHFHNVAEAGILCVGYVIARIVGKVLGGTIAGSWSKASRRIWINIGMGLVPQAGVAIGLVVLLSGNEDIPNEISELIGTLVLGAVAINEIIGPFFTRMSLQRAKEVNKDRRRLMEFLQEEFILVGLTTKDKWEALDRVADFYCRTHRVPQAHRSHIHQSIIEREKEHPTAIGLGAAIPHGRTDVASEIGGVLAICRDGIDFDAPDEEPVRLIMLIVTPAGQEREHLEVMASLSKMISDETVRTRLLAAIDANDAWEIIESEETPNYNYYLDEELAEAEERDNGRRPG